MGQRDKGIQRGIISNFTPTFAPAKKWTKGYEIIDEFRNLKER